jgi:hypothetical protein
MASAMLRGSGGEKLMDPLDKTFHLFMQWVCDKKLIFWKLETTRCGKPSQVINLKTDKFLSYCKHKPQHHKTA